MILKIFWQLLKTDLIQVRKSFTENFINLLIWTICTIFINVYVMQKLGLSQNYGELMIAGIIVSAIWFQMIHHIFTSVADFCGERHIDYNLTLPISNILIFIKSICTYIIHGLIFSILGLLICKAMLLDKMILSKISIIHLSISLILSSIFFSTFTLCLIGYCPNPGAIGNVIHRVMFPLWFMGGFLFPWETLYKMTPSLGIISLLNPYTHITEMLRVATIGQKGFLPFLPSCGALIIMTLVVGYMGMKKLKKRLDFI